MEALERRFTAAKAQLLQQQKEGRKETFNGGSSLNESRKTNLLLSSLSTSPEKVAEDNGFAHLQLCQPVNKNLLTANVKFSSTKGNVVDRLLHDLLQSGDSVRKYTQRSRSMKIDNRILLDNYVPTRNSFTGSHVKALRRNSKCSKRRMFMKRLKKSGAFDLPEYLQKKNWLTESLLSADLHGAFVLVAECKINSFIGLNGIMLVETTNTFGIITRE